MTKLSDIFEVLYESELMPITDGEVIIIPNVALNKTVDLKSKLNALDSDIEPMGYNRYQLIIPDEVDMEYDEDDLTADDSEESENIEDSADDEAEEKDSKESEESEESEDTEEKDSEKEEKMEKAVDEICDIIADWIKAEPVDESVDEEQQKHCNRKGCLAKRFENVQEEMDLSEVINQMSECDSKPQDLKRNEFAIYLESFANPDEIYEAQEDEYIKEEPKEEAPKNKDISSYLTSAADDVIDITEPAERQGLIDLLVHNKEVLWGPTSAKIQAYRSELEGLEDAELEARANKDFPEWRKHVKKYIVEPEPEPAPKADEGEPVEDEVPEEVPEAAEEFQPEVKPDEQVLTEEPSNGEIDPTEELVRDCLNKYSDPNKETFEPAIKIITKWYKNEGGIDSELSLEDIRKDIEELINAASDVEEIKIVGDALGMDPDVLPDYVEEAVEETVEEEHPEDCECEECLAKKNAEKVDEDVRMGPGFGQLEDFINSGAAFQKAPDKAGSKAADVAKEKLADKAE